MISLLDVSKTLPSGSALIKTISLELQSNEISGLLGPNGAGKTTLFSLLLGLSSLSSGDIFFEKTCITKMPPEKRIALGIAYLPQEGALFQELSVFENLACVIEARQKKLALRSRIELVDQFLEKSGLTSVAHKKVFLLSGGQKRRLEFARLLASNPKYILLDEPFAGVDPRSIEDIQKHILFLKQNNIGILISDHNISATLEICDNAHLMIDGTIIASGRPDDLLSNKMLCDKYFGELYGKSKVS